MTEAMPEFPVVGEVILRRWLHDDHVDSLAAMLQPLGIDWFHATPGAAGSVVRTGPDHVGTSGVS